MTKTAVLVTGSRDWHDHKKIRTALYEHPVGTLVIHGDAGGADSIARNVAEARGMPIAHVPYFKGLGRAGGPVRNSVMLDIILGLQGRGYEVRYEAFHPDISKSKGTKDMVTKCDKAGMLGRVHA